MVIAVKICGLTDPQAIKAVVASGANYAGFIYFQKSPRHIALPDAAKLKAMLPPGIQSVSVLVDPEDSLLAEIQEVLNPNYIQLHGKETPERLAHIRSLFPSLKLIKAIKIRSADDVAEAGKYSHYADILLFDAMPTGLANSLPGGNGLSFDWALLKGRDFPLPWMLSGGLTNENVADAIRQTGAKMVDVSSGVEERPGVKDPELIKIFIEAVHGYEAESEI